MCNLIYFEHFVNIVCLSNVCGQRLYCRFTNKLWKKNFKDNKRDATGSVYANITASANAKTQYNWLKTKNAQNGCVSILTEAGNISNNFENPYSFSIKPIYKGQCVVVVVVVLWLKITLY